MLRVSTVFLAAVLAGAATASAAAAAGAAGDREVSAARATQPIVLDGALDDRAWQSAPPASGFTQSEPHEGEPATEATEVRVLYDADTLYVGVFAHDVHPVLVNELKKDFDTSSADVFEVVLDTFDDGRNGYLFAVNAMGAKWDAQTFNEGRDVNSNWDGIWHVRTRIVKGGWTAEIAIPFRTLRFNGASQQTWGINFLRRIRHRNEDSYWSPVPRMFQITRTSLEGRLQGLRGVHPGRDLRLKPYVLTSSSAVAPSPSTGSLQGGFDAKYGITSGLTWDFTVNTDFSQVEADEQQVNLTRFSLFFPEKRDFFLENSGVFQFGTPNGGGGGSGAPGGRTNGLPDNVLFFSRRIGLSDDGQALPILGGTRLTGHAGAYTIGALNIQQRRSASAAATNFTAVRLRRNILANSDVGVMVLDKQQHGGGFNRLFGADANFQFFEKLNLNGFVSKTASPASVVGGTGHDLMWRAGTSYRGEVIDTSFAYTSTGDRFDDELGFIPRVGIARTDFKFGPHLRPAAVSGWLREIYPHYQLVDITRTSDGTFDSRYMDFHLPFNFQDGSFMEVGHNTNLEVLTQPFTINTTRNVVVNPGRYGYDENFVTATTSSGRAVSFNGRIGVGTFYDGRKRSYQAGTTVRFSARLNTSLSVLQNVVRLSDGSFDTTLITGRVNYGFSTHVFLNALIQYNTDIREWSSNVRFDWIHHSLSDLFLVYNDHRDTIHGQMLDRSVAAKMTYMMAF
ncbi:MAG: DUF5916 domain-containing protein [Betaproteobacteria bacterium]